MHNSKVDHSVATALHTCKHSCSAPCIQRVYKAQRNRARGRNKIQKSQKYLTTTTHMRHHRDMGILYRDRGLDYYREHTRHPHQCNARSPLARRAAEQLFFCASLVFTVTLTTSPLEGVSRQLSMQLGVSLPSARCLVCHAARHELMVVYRQNGAPLVVRHSRKSRRTPTLQ